MSDDDNALKVGAVAKAAGVGVQMLHYYERSRETFLLRRVIDMNARTDAQRVKVTNSSLPHEYFARREFMI
jgi:AcrR family transcriptional regulator